MRRTASQQLRDRRSGMSYITFHYRHLFWYTSPLILSDLAAPKPLTGLRLILRG